MFLIRADGNAKIGAGHLMRCLTIAEALREVLAKAHGMWESCGAGILFLCADQDSAALVEAHGFRARALGTDYRYMEEELPGWEKLVLEECADPGPGEAGFGKETHVILIDSYYVTSAYLESLKTYGSVILLEDMGKKAYPVDGVINYNAFAKEERYRELYRGTRTRIWAGSLYVPVRRQFLGRDYRVSETVENVLITTGGGDVSNIAGQILTKLDAQEEAKKLNYHLIIGRYSPHLKEMEALAGKRPRIHLYHDVQDMAGLMERCDLAVTAGGTTIYELAAVGVPFLCFSYAENQELLTEYIREKQIAGYAGAYHREPGETLEQIGRVFWEFLVDKEKRNMSYLKERNMIDGKGALRIAEALLEMR